jgi:5'-nucleotidase/UDP-sugar diphosphatase
VNRLRRYLQAAAASVLLLIVLGGCATTANGGTSRLTVVHVNDTHSHLFPFVTPDNPHVRGGFARLATVLREVRDGGDPVLLLHGGDAVCGSPADYLLAGKPDYARIPTYGWRGIDVVDAMNRLGFDAMVLGNHELDYGRRWLELLMARARYAVVSANVLHRDIPDIDGTTGEPLARPFVIVQKGNLRIGIIGITTTEYLKSLQAQVEDPLPVLQALVPDVSRRCDLLIVLSHVGYEGDLELARKVPGIDLIVGGHTHTLLPEPVVVGSTLVVQDGQFAEQVGILELAIADGAIASYQYRLRSLEASVPEDPAVDAALRQFLAIGSVGTERLAAITYQRSGLGSLATSAMLAATGADAALIAADSLNGALGPGSPSVQEFFSVFWPYHPRSLPPEKDLSERQLLSTLAAPQGGASNAGLRAVVKASDGLRTLVVATIPAAAFADWLAVNEARLGSSDYVQVDSRTPPEASSAPTRTVAMPIDLVMRIGRLGLPIDLQRLEVKEIELFEAVLDLLGTPIPRPEDAAPCCEE